MPSLSATKQCVAAVDQIYHITKFVLEHGWVSRLGPTFAFSVWVAARLLLVHGSTVERSLSPQIGFFVEALREVGRYWPVARRYCELLERVLEEHHANVRRGTGMMADSIAILADMRRTAYDLDWLISRQPQQSTTLGQGDGDGGGGGGAGSLGTTAPGLPLMVQGGGGGLMLGRYPTVTPSCSPGPNEVACLDLFGFFNYPKMINSMTGFEPDLTAESLGLGMEGVTMDAAGAGAIRGIHPHNEFNITNFSLDVDSDWLFKQETGGRFLAPSHVEPQPHSQRPLGSV
jgi:hypothetical protein